MNAATISSERGFDIHSYGTGSCVRIPGPTVHQPNTYAFDSISYDEMYQDLVKKDRALYENNQWERPRDEDRERCCVSVRGRRGGEKRKPGTDVMRVRVRGWM